MYIVYKRGHVKKRLQQTNDKKVHFFFPASAGIIVIRVHLHDVHPFFIYLQKQASNNDSSSASDQTHYACMMQQHYQRNSTDLLYGSWNKKGELKCIIIMRIVFGKQPVQSRECNDDARFLSLDSEDASYCTECCLCKKIILVVHFICKLLSSFFCCIHTRFPCCTHNT